MLKSGHYYLRHTVVNPTPDRRRTRQQRSAPEWKAGTKIFVRDVYLDAEDLQRGRKPWTSMEFRADSYPGLYSVGPKSAQYLALENSGALVEVEEDYSGMMHLLDASDGRLLYALYKMEKITLADIERAANYEPLRKD